MQPLTLLPEMLVKTRVARFRPHSLLWADSEFVAQQEGSGSDDDKRRALLQRYAVGIRHTPSLQKLTFIPASDTDAYAERYGGFGLARNGGGVRCVNLGDVQIKGIGVNALMGADVLPGYNTGTLTITDGVMETVFARVLNHAFPIGAVKALGLIATHPTIATHRNADVPKLAAGVPCWGALLLRETCLRPGHLMRSMFYRVAPKHRHELPDDIVRLRQVQRSFRAHCGGDQGFLALLGRFIHASANQFAFAKIARYAHGTATASNMALDGRWLDLPISSFLPGNRNYRLSVHQVPFYTEQTILDPTLVELVYTYCKYNGVQLDVNPLLNYYHQLYKAFLHRHSSWLLGIPAELWPKPARDNTCDELVKLLLETLTQDTTLIWNSPYVFEADDPVESVLQYLYGNITPEGRGAQQWPRRFANSRFCQLLQRCYAINPAAAGGPLRSFSVACGIRALRRAYLASFFYSGRLRTRIESLLESTDPQVFGDLIHVHDQIASWAFNDDGERVSLFESQALSLWWSTANGAFMFQRDGEKPMVAADPLTLIDHSPAAKWQLDDTDLRPMLRAMTVLASNIEQNWQEEHLSLRA